MYGGHLLTGSFFVGILIGAVVFLFIGVCVGMKDMQEIAVSKDVAYYDSKTKEFKYINVKDNKWN